jgi:alpha-glucosidase
MIDDNWQKYYGNFDFKPDKFPDPRGMTDRLHTQGFKVMLWICPFVSGDSPEFRELEKMDYLVKDKKGGTAMIRWWNGISAYYDMTNPAAVAHFEKQLRDAQQKYGIDGYKFDAGDVYYMTDEYAFYDPQANVATYSQKWAELGLRFPYNEFRTSFKMGGTALVQRLGDKDYSWNAVSLLIPDMAAAGLLGHLYTCPDMIGGGSFTSFLNIDADKFDQELIVRSCQIHAMMPMMQFSVAPWRILDKEHLAICRKFALFHEQMGGYILECARRAAQTGEPIVRHMEYAFPHEGFIACRDQFMLGEKYLVAPMTTKGTRRSVKLPAGQWKDDLGKTHKGGTTIEIDVPISRLPYFERVK